MLKIKLFWNTFRDTISSFRKLSFNSYKNLSQSDKLVLTWLMLLMSFGMLMAILAKHPEHIATINFAAIVGFFTYKSYVASQNKFRFDLFHKRLETYENIVTFCSEVIALGKINANDDREKQKLERVFKSAQGSFRGQGFHMSSALFGPEVQSLLNDLNKTYAWLISYNERPPIGNPDHMDWPQKWADHMLFLSEVVNKLPEILKPYVYFGDVKDHQATL